MRTIFSAGRPIILFQRSKASSSVCVHGDHEARGIDPERDGHEVPGEPDRVLLEIIAEGKVAQHLEEGVMSRGVADVFEIVVFAAGTHAALARDCAHVVALIAPQKAVLELHHAGIGEQQRRVVTRNEAGGCDHGVAALAEKFEEGTADVRRTHERRFLGHRLKMLQGSVRCRHWAPSRSRGPPPEQRGYDRLKSPGIAKIWPVSPVLAVLGDGRAELAGPGSPRERQKVGCFLAFDGVVDGGSG